jgi:hypothetical protein
MLVNNILLSLERPTGDTRPNFQSSGDSTSFWLIALKLIISVIRRIFIRTK